MLRQYPPGLRLHAQRNGCPLTRRRIFLACAGVAGAVERLEGGDEVVFTVAYQV